MNTIKYSEHAVCPVCKGMLLYDAKITNRLPVGLGFAHGSAKFQVDVIVRKGWRGSCERGHEVFAVTSQRRSTRFPRSINRKIQLATT